MAPPDWRLQIPWDHINAEAVPLGFDRNLIAAIIAHESGFDSYRVRYEPNYSYLFSPRELAEQQGITVDTMTVCQKMSWGLMQVMGAVAFERGFRGPLPKLTDPPIGIKYGCLHLKWLAVRYGDTEASLIASYNAGHPSMTPGGMFQNQRYVDAVSAYLHELRSASISEA